MVATISSTGVLPLKRWLRRALVKISQHPESSCPGCYEPVQEIDIVGLKPPEALCNRLMNILRLIPDLAAPFGRYMVSEFCGQEDLLGNKQKAESSCAMRSAKESGITSFRLPVR